MRLRYLPLLALFALPLPASADSLRGTRSTEVYETAHTIELAFDRGHATLVVHRTFKNDGPKHDQAELHIYDLPNGGVATGLKTLGYVDGRPVWYTGELLEAELAAKRYQELTGIGGYYPKDPALLSWRSQSELALQVFPIDPTGGVKTVEYTLELPANYVNGAWHVELPRMSTGALSATVTPRAVNAKDSLLVDGSLAASKLMVAGASFELVPFDPPKLGGRFASVSFAKKKNLVHAAFEAAPTLSEAPKGAYVVIALDGSKSMDDGARAAEIASTSAYLRQLPDAKVQIVTYDRFVRPVTSGFVPAADGLATLKKMTFTPRNGSAVDLALEDLAQRLATAPSGAPRRALLLGDLRTRSAIDPSKLAPFAAQKAILHIGRIAGGSAMLYRDDASPWSAQARATGGLVWHARDDGKNLLRSKQVFEEWVRPLRIDRLAVKGIADDDLSFPESLAEGEGFSELRILPAGASSIEVKGELWSTPIKATFASTATEERRWSALVFGSDVMSSLSEPEMMTLAKKGGAVSPVTSYLAIEPGVRPSTEGLDETELGFGGLGMMGHGSGGGGAYMKVVNLTISRRQFLESRMTDALAACGGSGRALRVIFETTTREIVAADTRMPTAAKVAPMALADETLRHCVEERMWAIELPGAFSESFEKLDVSVAGT